MATLDFDKEVIQRSHDIPVLVDFWAPWCGPCRVLGPVLEQLAADQAGRWTLVKLNTEEETGLAEQFRIRSIPNVKLFHQGKEVAEFMGALPRRSIEQWLDQHLPDPLRDEMHRLLDALKEDPSPEALAELESFVEAHPDREEARLALASHLVFAQPARAKSLVESLKPGRPGYDTAEDINQVARLLEAGPTSDGKVADQLNQARQALQEGEMDTALEHLIQATMIDKTFDDDLPRRATIALFRLLGEEHELTRKHRRKFDMALY